MSWSPDLTIGELRPWPDAVNVVRGRTDETVRYVPERTATRIVRTYDGLTGICKCSSCERTISVYDKWCKHCGAMFVGTDYERVE